MLAGLSLIPGLAGPPLSAASDRASDNKKKPVEQQPWQRKPFSAKDEADEDNFRHNFLKTMMSLTEASYRRYVAEASLFPDIATSDPNEPVGTREALRGSTLLDLHEQGVIWLSLLLSSRDPSLQPFQATVLDGLDEDPALSVKQVRKKVRKYDITKQAEKKQPADLIVETENEFGVLVKDLNSAIPKTTDSREYYERLLAKYKSYLEGQMPRVLDLSRAGESTNFYVISPRFGNSTPLEKDIHYKRTAEEAKKKTVTARDVRYQGVYVVRVTPLDRRGERYHLVGFWLYLRINDPEMYVPRDPARALTSAGGWDLHHMPPAEFADEGLVSPPTEWMEIHVSHGKLVIVKGRSTFLQRRAASINLAQTPVDRLQPAEGDIDPTPPRISLSPRDYARVSGDFAKLTAPSRDTQAPKPLVDRMPAIPPRYEFPDTPEGEQAYREAREHAISPASGKASVPSVSVPSAKTAVTSTREQPAPAPVEVASVPAPSTSPIQAPPPEMLDPGKMRLEFNRLPAPAEAWLNMPYTAPTAMQQERLRLVLYWLAQFLSDAKAGNTPSDALRLLIGWIPGKVYCVNNQSVHSALSLTGAVVIAGMKSSFDASLPDLAMELLSAMESRVPQFGNGQPNAQTYRSEIRRAAEQFFSSQPLDPQDPDPFLLAAHAAPPTVEQWKLLTLPRAWDCPNPYRFFETRKADDDETPPAKLDEDTIARLKLEKANVTELGLDGIFNKDKQGNYRNDQGALLPLGLLFQLTMKEPAGLLLLARAEENERVLAVNSVRAGEQASAAAHLSRAKQVAGMLETVKTLRKAAPNAYLDIYLIKEAPEKRTAGNRDNGAANTGGDAAGLVWRARWIQYKDRWTLLAGVRQSDIPINAKLIEHLADAMNEKLPAGASVLPALQLLKGSVQNSSDPQYGSYASMFADMDHREPAATVGGAGTTNP